MKKEILDMVLEKEKDRYQRILEILDSDDLERIDTEVIRELIVGYIVLFTTCLMEKDEYI